MFDMPGTLYVYRSYGVHWCANVVTGPLGVGAAVLLRGGSPLIGEQVMAERRGRSNHLCDGPGKLSQAMGLDQSVTGIDLLAKGSPVRLIANRSPSNYRVGPRVGITRAIDRPWRFRSVNIRAGLPE
jgi:DNA-3-methyladenine glycosylase